MLEHIFFKLYLMPVYSSNSLLRQTVWDHENDFLIIEMCLKRMENEQLLKQWTAGIFHSTTSYQQIFFFFFTESMLISWFYSRPDMTSVVDWALKANFISHDSMRNLITWALRPKSLLPRGLSCADVLVHWCSCVDGFGWAGLSSFSPLLQQIFMSRHKQPGHIGKHVKTLLSDKLSVLFLLEVWQQRTDNVQRTSDLILNTTQTPVTLESCVSPFLVQNWGAQRITILGLRRSL